MYHFVQRQKALIPVHEETLEKVDSKTIKCLLRYQMVYWIFMNKQRNYINAIPSVVYLH